MARRKQTIIDGEIIHVESDATIRDVLTQAGIENPPSVVSGGEVITASDFDRPAPAHGMLINQTDLSKGATLRDQLLNIEYELISRFLADFHGKPAL